MNRSKGHFYLAPRGIVFTLSVCLCVYLSIYLSVCVQPIFLYFISRLLEEILIWNFYWILIGLYSIYTKILTFICQRSRSQGWLHCFLKVQSYHKNWAIEKFQFFFHRHLLGYSIRWNNKNWSEQRNDATNNTSIFDFKMQNSYTEVTISHKIVKKSKKYGSHTHILYECAKFGDDRTSFNVIFDVCDV